MIHHTPLSLPANTPFRFIPLPGATEPWTASTFCINGVGELFVFDEAGLPQSNTSHYNELNDFWQYLGVFLILGMFECFETEESE